MSGLTLVLNIAKDALLAQQYAIDVVSHNITNMNTEGYSKQNPILRARDTAPLSGFMFGRGVELDNIMRDTNSFIENRLQQRESDLMSLSQKEIYLNVMEGIFNESSGRSLSSQFDDFWAAWHDLSNNPSGLSERSILYESGALLAQGFNEVSTDLNSLTVEINSAIDASVDHMNQILTQIADINEQIVSMEVRGGANDLRDQRNILVRELSDYININTLEHSDGNITVTTGKGYTLVSKANSYPFDFAGTDVTLQGSNNSQLTITDAITGGKIGGLLDLRDEIIPKYEADFDELAEGIVWELNKIHTQGVGLTGFTDITGTYSATLNSAEEMGTVDSGLAFWDSIEDGDFKFWLYDNTGALVPGAGPGGETIVNIVKAGTTMDALAVTISGIHADVTATVTADNNLQITTANSATFAFSDDTSNVLAALGLNTFFTGTDANTMATNSVVGTQKGFIAAAQVDATNGTFAAGDNTNALDIANLQYQGVDLLRWTYTRGSSPTSENITGTTLDTFMHTLAGSVGIKSQSIQREKEYAEVIVNNLSQTRNNISAISLDEEMTNLIKYQQAYAAAAKLVSVSDELMSILLSTK